jgi:hypothetical protein
MRLHDVGESAARLACSLGDLRDRVDLARHVARRGVALPVDRGGPGLQDGTPTRSAEQWARTELAAGATLMRRGGVMRGRVRQTAGSVKTPAPGRRAQAQLAKARPEQAAGGLVALVVANQTHCHGCVTLSP